MNLFGWDKKTFRRNAVCLLALLSVFMVIHEIIGRNGYLTLRRQKKEYSELQQKVQTLSQDNQLLEQKINALKNNPEAIEKKARDQLHLVKPGEFVYVLPDKKHPQPPATGQRTSSRQSQSRQ